MLTGANHEGIYPLAQPKTEIEAKERKARALVKATTEVGKFFKNEDLMMAVVKKILAENLGKIYPPAELGVLVGVRSAEDLEKFINFGLSAGFLKKTPHGLAILDSPVSVAEKLVGGPVHQAATKLEEVLKRYLKKKEDPSNEQETEQPVADQPLMQSSHQESMESHIDGVVAQAEAIVGRRFKKPQEVMPLVKEFLATHWGQMMTAAKIKEVLKITTDIALENIILFGLEAGFLWKDGDRFLVKDSFSNPRDKFTNAKFWDKPTQAAKAIDSTFDKLLHPNRDAAPPESPARVEPSVLPNGRQLSVWSRLENRVAGGQPAIESDRAKENRNRWESTASLASAIGKRSMQEDACVVPGSASEGLTHPQEFLKQLSQKGYDVYVVADGLGGHDDGEKASKMGVTGVTFEIARLLLANVEPSQALEKAIEKANANLIEKWSDRRGRHKPGTTLVVSIVDRNQDRPQLYVGHVGDSRAYLQRGDNNHNGRLNQITRDHNIGNHLLEGGMSPADVQANRLRNVLTQSIGGADEVGPSLYKPIFLEPGDRLLMCTDGSDRPLTLETLNKILGDPSLTREQAIKRLVDSSVAAGGEKADNSTAVVVDFSARKEDNSRVQTNVGGPTEAVLPTANPAREPVATPPPTRRDTTQASVATAEDSATVVGAKTEAVDASPSASPTSVNPVSADSLTPANAAAYGILHSSDKQRVAAVARAQKVQAYNNSFRAPTEAKEAVVSPVISAQENLTAEVPSQGRISLGKQADGTFGLNLSEAASVPTLPNAESSVESGYTSGSYQEVAHAVGKIKIEGLDLPRTVAEDSYLTAESHSSKDLLTAQAYLAELKNLGVDLKIIANGQGAVENRRVSSILAINTIVTNLKARILQRYQETNSVGDADSLSADLNEAILAANKILLRTGKSAYHDLSETERPGAAIAVSLVANNHLITGRLGEAEVYYYNEATQKSERVENQTGGNNDQRLGVSDQIDPEIRIKALEPGDGYLLTTPEVSKVNTSQNPTQAMDLAQTGGPMFLMEARRKLDNGLEDELTAVYGLAKKT